MSGSSAGSASARVHRKELRPVSTCIECQRRKIKCDRSLPCGSCKKRGRSGYCTFDDVLRPLTTRSGQPELARIDSDEIIPNDHRCQEMANVLRRLAHLESLVVGPSGSLSETSMSPTASIAGPSSIHIPFELPAVVPTSIDSVDALERHALQARVPALRALHAIAQSDAANYSYLQARDMELTLCSTSLLAEPSTLDQDGRPRSAASIGLDISIAPADVAAIRAAALDQIFAILPEPNIARYLISKYFDEMEWQFPVLDAIAFPVEYERYLEMAQQRRLAFVDPLWVACFCLLLALAIDGLWFRPNGRCDLDQFQGLSVSDLKDLPSCWCDAAVRALQLGDWGGMPRIRALQACILYGHYIQLASPAGQRGRFLSWRSAGFSIGQRLGLGRLGSDPGIMPPDDPALPPGKNALKREIGVRLWHHLVVIDSYLTESPSVTGYTLHSSQYNTAAPRNQNLSAFSRTSWIPPAAAPLNRYTDASFLLAQCRIAEQLRRASDVVLAANGPLSMSTTAQLSEGWVSLFSAMADVFSPDMVDSSNARVNYERATLHSAIYCRVVRLSRPYLFPTRSQACTHRQLGERCLAAAAADIEINTIMLQIDVSRWSVYTSAMQSVLVVVIALFHAIERHHSEQGENCSRVYGTVSATGTLGEDGYVAQLCRLLDRGCAIFKTHTSIPALDVVVREGHKILTLLSTEAHRQLTIASDPAPGARANVDSLTLTLKRIARQVAAETTFSSPNGSADDGQLNAADLGESSLPTAAFEIGLGSGCVADQTMARFELVPDFWDFLGAFGEATVQQNSD